MAQDGSLLTEWVSSEAAPWIRYTWSSEQAIDTVRIFDRADLTHWCSSGELTFSDGSFIHVTGGILNNGAMREAKFPTKSVTWMQFTVTRNTGSENGLTDLQVYSPGLQPPPPPPASPGDFNLDFQQTVPSTSNRLIGRYPPNPNGIDWKYADWTTRSKNGNRYAYVNWPDSKYVWRMFMIPQGKVLKSLKVSGPPGSVVALSLMGQSDGYLIYPTSNLTQYETGWNQTPFSNIVAITIDTILVNNRDVTSVVIDDITYGDLEAP